MISQRIPQDMRSQKTLGHYYGDQGIWKIDDKQTVEFNFLYCGHFSDGLTEETMS